MKPRYYYSRTKVDGMYRVFDRDLNLWVAACPYKEAAHLVANALNVEASLELHDREPSASPGGSL